MVGKKGQYTLYVQTVAKCKPYLEKHYGGQVNVGVGQRQGQSEGQRQKRRQHLWLSNDFSKFTLFYF